MQRALWGFEPGAGIGCKAGDALTEHVRAGSEVIGCREIAMGDSFWSFGSALDQLMGRSRASPIVAGAQPTARHIRASREVARLTHDVSILIAPGARLG